MDDPAIVRRGGTFLIQYGHPHGRFAAGGGDTLRQALARLTAHPLAGVLTGAAVTAVVQSSSAVTVLVLGLVGPGC